MRSEDRLAWVAIIISTIAAVFTGLLWWDAHEQSQLASDATVTFEVDTDKTSDLASAT
jgi:multidrug resistance efflux pump